MPVVPIPEPRRTLWSRRWIRRLTYLLATGATLVGVTAWVLQRPAVDAWIIAKADVYLRAEIGLGIHAERLEVHPFQGRLVLHHPSLGGDLLQMERLEVVLDLPSILHALRIRHLLLVSPRLRLDQQRLSRIRIKEHPPRSEPFKFILQRLEIRDGFAQVAEPAWGLPRGEFTFRVDGWGSVANQVRLELQAPTLNLGEGRDRFQGDLSLQGLWTDQKTDVTRAVVHLGGNTLTVQGSYTHKSRALEASAQGRVDLAEVSRLAAPGRPALGSGQVDFNAKAHGPFDHLAWRGSVQGTGIQAKALPLRPGSFHSTAAGGPDQLRLENFHWISPDGTLEAQGGWTRRDGTTLDLKGAGLALAPAASYTRVAFLNHLSAQFEAKAKLPGAPWAAARLDLLRLEGSAQFLQDGRRVGGLVCTLADQRLQATGVDLTLPQFEFHGKAGATLAKAGLRSLDATGEVRTDAREVAAVLQAWDKVTLDMSGATQATAEFHWDASTGIRLTGRANLLQPRWHGAVVDRIQAEVTLEGSELRVSNLELEKDAGRAWGDLWLTWAKLPPGAEQMDMCYRFFRLPIQEGLKAGDQGDLPIQGTGSGWVRLHGPYDHILMEGRGLADSAEAFGLQIPAASTDFFMDIAQMRLKTTDVRVADSLAHLGHGEPAPTGPLAVTGDMNMDIHRGTWQVRVDGDVDSRPLGLPGPQFQAKVKGRFDGPFTAPFGPSQLPEGALSFSEGRLAQGEQTLEGLEGALSFDHGILALEAGLKGMPRRVLQVAAHQVGTDRLDGTVVLEVGKESADTAALAARLTEDFLKDANVEFRGRGAWGPEGLTWRGQLERFIGQFEGFQLAQVRPTQLDGDLQGMNLALELEGRTGPDTPAPAPLQAPTPTRVALNGRLPFSPQGPLALNVTGAAELANLKSILDHLVQPGQYSLLADMHPAGSAKVDLKLGGSLEEATLDGSLTLKGGQILVRTYPQSIENLDFTALFHGREITIPEATPLTGTLAQGALRAWGAVTWQVGGLSNYNLNATLADFQMRDLPEGFELEGSLDATLFGNDQDGGLLKGSIRARHMLYRADINLKDLLIANALGGVPLSPLDFSDPLSHIDLDLNLQLDAPWDIDTNLLKLQGRPRGDFRVRGPLTHPGLQGKMDFLPGGRVTNLFPAGDIVLERGTMDFRDPLAFNPNIDAQGRVEVPPYLVTLNINGTLDALQFNPTSTPSLRQDEIMAILIDPDAAASVGSTPGFSTQVAMNTGLANTTSGVLSSLALATLQERLRKTLSLDRVSVAFRSGLGTPETSLILGKSVEWFGHRTPLVFTHRKLGENTTYSLQGEWRFGNIVLQLGASQTTGDTLHPSGEIRHTWVPK